MRGSFSSEGLGHPAALNGIVLENLLNPNASGPVRNGLTFPIFESCTDIQLKKRLDDLTLCGSCLFRAGSTMSCVLDRKMKRHGPGFIFQRRVAARFQKAAHSGGGSRAYRPGQRRSTILVLGVDVRAGAEQTL